MKNQKTLITRTHNTYGFLFIAPALIVLSVFYLYPLLKTFYLGFTEWNILSSPDFLGLENYQRLFTDTDFRQSFWVTLYYVFGTTALTIPLGFFFAILLNRVGMVGNIFKSIYFTPVVLSVVISSVLWVSIYNPFSGIMMLLRLPFNLSTQNWYQSPGLVVPGLIIFSLWKGLGLYIVIFLAALKSLPESYFEAARIDGASGFRIITHITFPLLKPIFLFNLVICIVYGFQNFAIVYTSTKGGPLGYSRILPILIYENAFKFFRMGYASSIAILMFVVMFGFSYLQFYFFKSEVE